MKGGHEQGASIGPYRITGVLGRGGMGVVYDAVEPETGERVAVKTVRLDDVELGISLRREIHALTRLRHPGIVAVVSEGIQDGRPWYAMKRILGPSLRDHATRHWAHLAPDLETAAAGFDFDQTTDALAETRPMATSEETVPAGRLGEGPFLSGGADADRPRVRRDVAPFLSEILSVIHELCGALTYLHGEGVVHRDLKPENILLEEGNRPVLVDFGLTTRFGSMGGRDSLKMTAGTTGTLLYMAPEQSRGEFVDARADLYSLGCILYELIAGVPPFGGRTAYEIIVRHATASLESLSVHVDGVPEKIDALVAGLLAKEPRRRIGYADVVASVLEEVLDEMGLEAAGPPPAGSSSYLYRPQCVGRAGPLDRLRRVLEGTRRGRGGFVRIVGESGLGKTRLALELGAEAAGMGVRVEIGECFLEGKVGLAPLQPLLRGVADRCLQEGPDATHRLLGASARILADIEPRLKEAPGYEEAPVPVALPPDAESHRRNAALSDLLVALCSESGLMLILDDVQWADPLTLDFLRHVARRDLTQGNPLVLVGTSRPGDLPDWPGVEESGPPTPRKARGRGDGERYAGLGRRPGRAPRLHRRTSRPVTRLRCRSCCAAPWTKGSWRGSDGGRWVLASESDRPFDDAALPGSVQGLIARRLERVVGEERGAARSGGDRGGRIWT